MGYHLHLQSDSPQHSVALSQRSVSDKALPPLASSRGGRQSALHSPLRSRPVPLSVAARRRYCRSPAARTYPDHLAWRATAAGARVFWVWQTPKPLWLWRRQPPHVESSPTIPRPPWLAPPRQAGDPRRTPRCTRHGAAAAAAQARTSVAPLHSPSRPFLVSTATASTQTTPSDHLVGAPRDSTLPMLSRPPTEPTTHPTTRPTDARRADRAATTAAAATASGMGGGGGGGCGTLHARRNAQPTGTA